jgi:hypothetical protein
MRLASWPFLENRVCSNFKVEVSHNSSFCQLHLARVRVADFSAKRFASAVSECIGDLSLIQRVNSRFPICRLSIGTDNSISIALVCAVNLAYVNRPIKKCTCTANRALDIESSAGLRRLRRGRQQTKRKKAADIMRAVFFALTLDYAAGRRSKALFRNSSRSRFKRLRCVNIRPCDAPG